MSETTERATAQTWIKRWQEPDGSWHIVLTPGVLVAVSKETFRQFLFALYAMEDDIATKKGITR